MFTKSIRWRFISWLAFLLIGILGGFGVTAYQLHRTNQFRQIDDELERRLSAVSACVRAPPFGGRGGHPPPFDNHDRDRGFRPNPFWEDHGPGGPGGPPPDFKPGNDSTSGPPRFSGPRGFMIGPREIHLTPRAQSLFDESDTNGFYFAVWSRDAFMFKTSTNAPAGIATPEKTGAESGTHVRVRDHFREAYHYTEIGESVLVGRDITADIQELHGFAGWLVAAGAGILALGLGGGWRLATRAIRPVEEIGATASRISAGNLSERIDLADTENELGRLAVVLNSTFARLDAAFAQQKQFTADASHELRTPLAVLISEAQSTLARDRSPAEYRETIEACLDAAQQMRRLTESLLELARIDANSAHIRREPVDLSAIAQRCVAKLRPLAELQGVSIQADLQPAALSGNADSLAQVMTNLLSNAIYYNRPGGQIRISTAQDSGAAILTVSDTGKGIEPADLPHIFERFYRADKSRSRADGHCGLGLAITKAIVDAHGGNIAAESKPGAGSEFTIHIPAKPAPTV